MAKQVDKKIRDWTRCSEGFSNFTASDAINKHRKDVKKRSSADSFSHGNIFEKLGLPSEEETSQSIAWSSNDSDEDVKLKPAAKKQKKSVTPKTAPRKRRSSPRNRQKFTPEEAVDIQSDSDTEKGSNSSNATVVTQPSSALTKQSQEVSIHGYDSDPDNREDDKLSQSENKKSPPSSPSIRTSPSTASPVSQSVTQSLTQTGTGVKASDWIKSLQLKTPSKSDKQSVKSEVEDSAKKKKKKHSRGGLAERLGRLQSRDKSSVRMWSHQQNKPSSSQDSKSLSLEVVGYESLYSMRLVKCLEYSQVPRIEAADRGSGQHADGDADKAVTDTKLVMFPASQSDNLNVQIGTKFTIFPPWQQLELNDGQQILLCTKYCQLNSQPNSIETVAEVATTLNVEKCRVVEAIWSCPCAQGLCRSKTLCPAYQFPSVPGLIQVSTSESGIQKTEKKDSNSNVVKTAEKCTRHLHIISASSTSAKSLTHPKSLRSLTKSSVCDYILESIEASRNTIDNQGDGTLVAVSFKGHIHRAVMYREQGQKRCRLLIEDGVGTVCEVQLSTDTLLRLDLDPHTCEGQSLQFSGLCVQDRVTRDRDKHLFTMIDHIWSGKVQTAASQDSHTSTDIMMNSSTTTTAQEFCYILHEDNSPTCTFNMQPCQSIGDITRDDVYAPLGGIEKMSAGKSCRCSCVAKLIYIQSESKNDLDCVLYVTDKSISKVKNYVKVMKQSNCEFTYDGDRNIIILRDLFIEEGKIYADGYCKITRVTDEMRRAHAQKAIINSLFRLNVVLGNVKNGLKEKALCSASGVITEVDEDSAYSWEACTHCGGEQLQADSSSGELICSTCKEIVTSPETKMKMEVVVKCATLNSDVKIDLLQSTIEKILPMDEDEDEGYELSSVLNKYLGPLTCVVETAGPNHDQMLLREIQLLR